MVVVGTMAEVGAEVKVTRIQPGEFIKTTNFFPKEKYIKQVKLNGYKYT